MFCKGRRNLFLLLLCLAVGCYQSRVWAAPQHPDAVSGSTSRLLPTTDEIAKQLDSRNRERADALRGFEGTRIYRMNYEGFFGTRRAQMVVTVKSSSDERQFAIESQSGSKFIVEHIFKRLLDEERESATAGNRQRTALNTNNYDFKFLGLDTTSSSPAYILEVIPKTDVKYLYRGKIWVDARDFAVTRIEAEPAKNPSIWLKKTEIKHRYEKVEDFWLPAENRTDSSIRFGGHALLSIEYKDYKITGTPALDVDTSASCEISCGER